MHTLHTYLHTKEEPAHPSADTTLSEQGLPPPSCPVPDRLVATTIVHDTGNPLWCSQQTAVNRSGSSPFYPLLHLIEWPKSNCLLSWHQPWMTYLTAYDLA